LPALPNAPASDVGLEMKQASGVYSLSRPSRTAQGLQPVSWCRSRRTASALHMSQPPCHPCRRRSLRPQPGLQQGT